MQPISPAQIPLVSIIIPTYNHGRFILEAIESIWAQRYPAVEIVVIDDGSVDDTANILKEIKNIKYIYQQNQGLAAARNTGIKHCNGTYLMFLDADDWLLEDAIWTNIRLIKENYSFAFVSGGHKKIFVDINKVSDEVWEINEDHYLHLLQANYVGMHATVMYSRWIFDEYQYDINFKACEDYDLYLRIARKHPVAHHTKMIAAYRIHQSNMSGNNSLMLSTALKALGRQKQALKSVLEIAAYKRGRNVWKDYYCNQILDKLVATRINPKSRDFITLVKFRPRKAIKYLLNNFMLKSIIKQKAPGFALRFLHKLSVMPSYRPRVNEVVKGDFDRLTPFSTDFGYSRGGPVDRYYIENFLKNEAGCIKGRVLEIGDNEYTLLFGANNVLQSDILHVDETNKKATFIGDLSDAPELPDNAFDCIVLTQTLHLIYNYKDALATCYRILKPGGTLLLTTPGITPIDHGEWKKTWYWSFNDKAMGRMMKEDFKEENLEIKTYGNVQVATAFLYGMGQPEIKKTTLDHTDPHFQVIITVKAVK